MPRRPLLEVPDETVPTGSWCFRINVPASKAHVWAFLGALETLAFWGTWDRDAGHSGIALADRWKRVLDEIEVGCGMDDVRQNTEAPCTLEKLVDGTWSTFANLRLCPPLLRTLSDGRIQYSTDSGVSWADMPTDTSYNPHTDAKILPPRAHVTGQDTKCLAAANATNVFVTLHHELSGWFSAGAFVLAIGAAMLGIFMLIFGGPLGVAEDISIAGEILDFVTSLVDSAFTTGVQTDLTGIFYCRSDADGNFDDSQFAQVVSDLDARIASEGGIWNLIKIYVNTVAQKLGLNNANKTTAIAAYDCSSFDCGWCWEVNFAANNDGGFVADGVGHYASGQGWIADNNVTFTEVYAKLHLTSCVLTHAEFTASLTGVVAGYGGQARCGIYVKHDGIVTKVYDVATPNGTGVLTLAWTGSYANVTDVWLDFNVTNHQEGGSGSAVCTYGKLSGSGTSPLGASNC